MSCKSKNIEGKCTNEGDFCKAHRSKCFKMYKTYKARCGEFNDKCKLIDIESATLDELSEYLQTYRKMYNSYRACAELRQEHLDFCISKDCVDDGHLKRIRIVKARRDKCEKILEMIVKRREELIKEKEEKEIQKKEEEKEEETPIKKSKGKKKKRKSPSPQRAAESPSDKDILQEFKDKKENERRIAIKNKFINLLIKYKKMNIMAGFRETDAYIITVTFEHLIGKSTLIKLYPELHKKLFRELRNKHWTKCTERSHHAEHSGEFEGSCLQTLLSAFTNKELENLTEIFENELNTLSKELSTELKRRTWKQGL